MDETGVHLAVLNSLKVLVRSDDLRTCRVTGKDRTRITVIECISADFKVLLPLVIWPASTRRANWMTYPTPGWHYGIQENGYTDTAISLKWPIEVFNPQTKTLANGDTRLLISDSFGTHESAEIQRFCFENNIVLASLLLDSLCSERGYCYNNSHDSKLGWPGLEFTVFITINLEGCLSQVAGVRPVIYPTYRIAMPPCIALALPP